MLRFLPKVMYSFFTGFILFMFFSCRQSFFPEFFVSSCKVHEDRIELVFSEAYNTLSLERSLKLTCDGKVLNLDFEHQGTKAFITSPYGFSEIKEYTLTLSASCESQKGLSLSRDFIYTFSNRKNKELPFVKEISLADGSVCNEEVEEIVLTFSKEMSSSQSQNAISISPGAAFIPHWNEDCTQLKLTFTEPLKENTRYKIHVSQSACDSENLFLKESFSSIFLYKPDPIALEYKVALSEKEVNHLTKEAQIDFSFNKAMTKSSLSSSISLTPSLPFSLEFSNENPFKASIVFNSSIPWGSKCSLEVNLLDSPVFYKISFDKERECPPEFLSAVFYFTQEMVFDLMPETNYSTLVLSLEDFPLGEEKEIPLYLVFSLNSEASSIDLHSLLKSISLSATNSCLSLYAKTIETYSLEEMRILQPALVEKFLPADNLFFVSFRVFLENHMNDGLIRLNLSSEITDDLGNKLPSDIQLVVNKK